MGLESQSTINPRYKLRQIKPNQPSIDWIKFITPSSSFGPSLECPALESAQISWISPNLLNQPIKCFFDLLGSYFSNRSNWNMQWILECLVILITMWGWYHQIWEKKRELPNVTKVLLHVMLVLHNVRMVPTMWEKK